MTEPWSPDQPSDLLDRSTATRLGELVAAMREGRQTALEELYDATVDRLHALARAILRNAEDAEEVVCDTFSQAWTHAARFDPSRANALGWLMMICRSRALDRLRQRRAQRSGLAADLDSIAELADSAGGPEDLVALYESGGRVLAALERLGPERRRLVGLAFLQGLSHQEIAKTTKLPLGTVKSHVRRALAELRSALED